MSLLLNSMWAKNTVNFSTLLKPNTFLRPLSYTSELHKEQENFIYNSEFDKLKKKIYSFSNQTWTLLFYFQTKPSERAQKRSLSKPVSHSNAVLHHKRGIPSCEMQPSRNNEVLPRCSCFVQSHLWEPEQTHRVNTADLHLTGKHVRCKCSKTQGGCERERIAWGGPRLSDPSVASI